MVAASSPIRQSPASSPMRQSRRSVVPCEVFSLDCVVQQRFRKMLSFKRELASRGILVEQEGYAWDLTDREAVDELVARLEEDERRADRASFAAVWQEAALK